MNYTQTTQDNKGAFGQSKGQRMRKLIAKMGLPPSVTTIYRKRRSK